jgi:hypothetical protein
MYVCSTSKDKVITKIMIVEPFYRSSTSKAQLAAAISSITPDSNGFFSLPADELDHLLPMLFISGMLIKTCEYSKYIFNVSPAGNISGVALSDFKKNIIPRLYNYS